MIGSRAGSGKSSCRGANLSGASCCMCCPPASNASATTGCWPTAARRRSCGKRGRPLGSRHRIPRRWKQLGRSYNVSVSWTSCAVRSARSGYCGRCRRWPRSDTCRRRGSRSAHDATTLRPCRRGGRHEPSDGSPHVLLQDRWRGLQGQFLPGGCGWLPCAVSRSDCAKRTIPQKGWRGQFRRLAANRPPIIGRMASSHSIQSPRTRDIGLGGSVQHGLSAACSARPCCLRLAAADKR